MLQERKVELEQRKREFVEAIDKKLSVDEIRSEFSSLKKLNDISQKLEQLMRNPVDGNQLMRTLSKIHTELNAISAIQEDNKKVAGLVIIPIPQWIEHSVKRRG